MFDINTKEIQGIITNRDSRIEVARQSHTWFFHVYLSHYITYPTADFQKEFFALSEDETKNPLAIMAFRGSAKSTLFTLSYPIWSILGKQQKKFVILLGQTQRQARQHLINIRRELEGNDLLKKDLGPFKEQEDEWGSYSLVLPWYNARITAASMEQTIRGMRHKQYRPDLIICDDIEDLASVKTKEGRDKIHSWITSEIIPAGDLNTRLVFIGNLLHEDSFLMRLKEKIINKDLDGHFIEIPLIKDDKIAWPEKFKCLDDVKKLENKVSDRVAWEREYMLRIISTSERVIHPEWIQYYDEVPHFDDDHEFRFTATGVDLAISQKATADYTAMVSAHVFGYKDKLKIYITPNPVNKRMVHKETLDTAMNLSKSLGNGDMTWILVEDVGYQKSVVQELVRAGYPAKGVKVHGSDKRSRLALTSHLVQNGTILFPKKGTELLISQMIGFGVEKHDDLADAFSLLINKIISLDHEKYVTGIWFLNDDGEWRGNSWPIKGKEFEDDK
jgi:predicted phage terminase large subunit-like protein